MDTNIAMYLGWIHRNDRRMVFDWNKAARLIRNGDVRKAYAGLEEDWEWTGGRILRDGEPDMKSYTYLASCWAKPQL